jgi:type VI secretion system protein ImpH
VSAVAGDRVWDQQAKFRIRVGPLTYAEFCGLLPSGSAFRPLVELVRFFAGQEYDFDMQLILKATEVPSCRLGQVGADAPRLGWSTWLKTAEFAHDAEDAVFAAHVTYSRPQYAAASAEAGGKQDERELEVPDRQAEPYLPQLA